MTGYVSRLDRAGEALAEAEFVVIGGGAGLSSAAGIDYGGDRFEKYFADYRRHYGFADMYEGMFYEFASEEERWAHRARHILINRFEQKATGLYRKLYALAGGGEYFVLTTNVESQFAKSGFAEDRIFEVQGNYAYIQCASGCHDGLYYDEKLVRDMSAASENFRIPASLIPVCPVCGGRMDVHVRKDGFFVQDADWYDKRDKYEAFIKAAAGRRTVFLELGVGYNTPGIIRFPFERMLYENDKAVLIRLNRDYPLGLAENRPRTIAFDENMGEVIDALWRKKRLSTD